LRRNCIVVLACLFSVDLARFYFLCLALPCMFDMRGFSSSVLCCESTWRWGVLAAGGTAEPSLILAAIGFSCGPLRNANDHERSVLSFTWNDPVPGHQMRYDISHVMIRARVRMIRSRQQNPVQLDRSLGWFSQHFAMVKHFSFCETDSGVLASASYPTPPSLFVAAVHTRRWRSH
jgi:hypothetical protein